MASRSQVEQVVKPMFKLMSLTSKPMLLISVLCEPICAMSFPLAN